MTEHNSLIDPRWSRQALERYKARLKAQREEAEERNKGKPSSPEDKPESPGKRTVSASINLSDYIQIPDTKWIISKNELYKGSNWTDSHFRLAENGLFMPTPAIFMDYLAKMIEATQRKRELFYADGRKMNRYELSKLASFLKRDAKRYFSWLNAKFVKDSDSWKIITSRVENGKLVEDINPLEECVKKSGHVEGSFNFNSQGMPIRTADLKKGRLNFYFYYPKPNCVTYIDITSRWISMFCLAKAEDRDQNCGTFGCCRG